MLLTRSLSSAIREAFRADFTSGFLDPRINFSRTTNATVTNSAGLITYAPMNLLTYSEQFDNAAWTKTASTISANASVAPNGTTTADKLVETATNAQHLINGTVTVILGNTVVFSVYAKAAERIRFTMRFGGVAPTNRATFDLSTGTVVDDLSASPTITSIGNGWYRCSISATTTGAGSQTPSIYLNTASGTATETYLGDGTSGLFIWGAQEEIGSTATTYNPTTVKNLLGFSELFDNAAWTKSNSFVQTNLLTYSEALDNAAWTKSGATITANDTLAPNGYQTADKLVETATTARHFVFPANYTFVLGTVYTISFYAKAAERTLLQISFATAVSTSFANIDLSTGTQTSGTSSFVTITPDINGFYRIVCTITSAGNATTNPLSLDVITNSTVGRGLSSYAGDGTSGIYVWGFQLVQGSVAGDYRRTDAAALPVYYPNHNGVVCAEKLVENTASGRHVIYQDVTTNASTPTTISFYAKAAERSFVTISGIFTGTSSGFGSIFDLTNGVCKDLSTSKGSPVPSITSVGNGWFRCSVQFTQSASELINRFIFAPSNSYSPSIDGSFRVATYTGDGTSGIYIFGAQLSDSASLDPYVLNAAAAPTAAAYYGARFDYDPVTLAPKGLLIEEQRANLVTYSSDLQSVAYDYLGTTWTPNQVSSPAGALTAGKLAEDTSLGRHDLASKTAIVTTAIPYTISVYAKAAERSWFKLRFAIAGSFLGAYFNVSTGTIGTTDAGFTATITNAGNGYYRCTVTTTAAVNSYFTGVRLASADNTDSYQGVSGNGMYFYGLQVEAGAFATSYIPTAASQVTRAADNAKIEGSNFYSWYNQNEGALIAWGSAASPNVGQVNIVEVSDGAVTFQNRITASCRANGVSGISANVQVGGTNQTAFSSFTFSTFNKVAVSYKINNIATSLNGADTLTDNSALIPLVNQLNIGANVALPLVKGQTIKQISYYSTQPENYVLKGLTA